jgi:hypothetical protein
LKENVDYAQAPWRRLERGWAAHLRLDGTPCNLKEKLGAILLNRDGNAFHI